MEGNLVANGGAEREVEPLVLFHYLCIYDACEEHSGEEADADTDQEGRCEAADRTGTEVVEDDGRDDGRQVRVEDGAECVAVTGSKCFANLLAGLQFFLRTLVDEHVGIDRHTQRQHHTGDTAHGEGCLEACQDADGEEEVQQQSAVGYHAGDKAVHYDHVDHEDDKRDDAAPDTLADGFCTERGTNDFFADDLCGSRHLT